MSFEQIKDVYTSDQILRSYLDTSNLVERANILRNNYFKWIGDFIYGKEGEYNRLEPVNRTYSVEEGIQARVKDPLWMLGRQWQMGEFNAENGGKPVRTEISYRSRLINKIKKLSDGSSEYSNLIVKEPLEKSVEEETEDSNGNPVSLSWDPMRLEYSFKLKGEGLNQSINNDIVLNAKEYDGNQLEWYNFDIERDINQVMLDGIETDLGLIPNNLSYTGMPSSRWWKFEDNTIDVGDIKRPHLNYLTMILLEFSLLYSNDWYYIPIKQHVGTLRQISRFKVIDSFGVITTVNPLVDASKNKQGFELFTLTSELQNSAIETPEILKNNGSLFFFPNNLIDGGLESKPVEEIKFLRDELANLVWAIEITYETPDGEVINRVDEDQIDSQYVLDTPIHYVDTETNEFITRSDMESISGFDPEQIGKRYLGPLPKFNLMSYIPHYWIPYVARQIANSAFTVINGQIKLRRARTEVDATVAQYKGKLLEESKFVNEEEIKRTGIKVQRVYQLGRDTDGNVCIWKSRKKRPDERHQSSGLRFDYLKMNEKGNALDT